MGTRFALALAPVLRDSAYTEHRRVKTISLLRESRAGICCLTGNCRPRYRGQIGIPVPIMVKWPVSGVWGWRRSHEKFARLTFSITESSFSEIEITAKLNGFADTESYLKALHLRYRHSEGMLFCPTGNEEACSKSYLVMILVTSIMGDSFGPLYEENRAQLS